MSPERSPDAEPFLPRTPEERADLDALRRAAAGCRGCGLYENATQTVFGDGSPGGRVMFVGEQPGDQEDRKGLPFVGPAGRVLDRALEEAGIERGDVYVTNAVKPGGRSPTRPRSPARPGWSRRSTRPPSCAPTTATPSTRASSKT